jgi:hypothetical protein
VTDETLTHGAQPAPSGVTTAKVSEHLDRRRFSCSYTSETVMSLTCARQGIRSRRAARLAKSSPTRAPSPARAKFTRASLPSFGGSLGGLTRRLSCALLNSEPGSSHASAGGLAIEFRFGKHVELLVRCLLLLEVRF